jgi:glycosyltransferase involved in cell wall biosynthesis
MNKDKVRLLDISDFYGFHTGGIATFINNKARIFQELGLPVEHRVVFPSHYDGVHQRFGSTFVSIKSMNVQRLAPNYFLHTRFRKLYRAIDEFQPDVVEIDSTTTMAYAASVYAMQKGIPLLGIYHTDLVSSFRLLFRWPALAERVSRIYIPRLYNRCKSTIVASHTFLRQLEGLGVNRLVHIPLGVNKRVFYPRSTFSALSPLLPKELQRPIGVYAGRLSSDKNVHLLLDAIEAKKSPGSFLIVGDGKLKERLLELQAKRRNVFYLGFVENQDLLAELFSFADYYVTACTSETYGLSLMEAQCCGLPVLCVDSPVLRENLDSKTSVFVPSPQILKSAMEAPPTSTRANSKAFDWQEVFLKLFALYTEYSGMAHLTPEKSLLLEA